MSNKKLNLDKVAGGAGLDIDVKSMSQQSMYEKPSWEECDGSACGIYREPSFSVV